VYKGLGMRREEIKELLAGVLGLAGALAIVRGVAHPHGWLWSGLEIGVLVLFVVGLIAWLEAARRERTPRR
jgi:hypothetical protein